MASCLAVSGLRLTWRPCKASTRPTRFADPNFATGFYLLSPEAITRLKYQVFFFFFGFFFLFLFPAFLTAAPVETFTDMTTSFPPSLSVKTVTFAPFMIPASPFSMVATVSTGLPFLFFPKLTETKLASLLTAKLLILAFDRQSDAVCRGINALTVPLTFSAWATQIPRPSARIPAKVCGSSINSGERRWLLVGCIGTLHFIHYRLNHRNICRSLLPKK